MSLFDDLLNYEKNSSSSMVKPINSNTAARPISPQLASKQTLVKQAIPPKPVVDSHRHPSAQGGSVQKVDYAKYGSEGCEQHYNDRYSTTNPILSNEDNNIEYNRIAKTILLGEALATPRSKKPWKPR